ncbi:MAG: hypothetical protein PHW31_02490 [Candidatus Pacebacteria bacterium]|nr:hypothetical protein [Candidatus Paceibacterota bacterium]
MKKTLISILFFSFLVIISMEMADGVVASSKIFTPENSMVENPNNLPDPLQQYNVEGEVKGFFAKMLEKWKPINEGGSGFWSKRVWPFLMKWGNKIEQNIRQGLAEEKEEYKQDFFKAIGKAWERIKNFVLHK